VTNVTSTPSTVYVSFSAEINANTTESLIAVMADCVSKGVPHVYLLLSTPGGTVMNGMNLYNVLRGMPFELTTHNVGNVDSIGNVIFLAGSKRYACPHSTFMFHGVGFDGGGQRFEEQTLRERLQNIVSDHTRIGAVIAQNSNLSPRAVADLFRKAQTKDAAYAVSRGIVYQIKDVQIPLGAPVVTLVFKR